MSKRTQRIPHLVFTSGVGFQYYFALPKAMRHIPGLPKAVRWSLGAHYETAKQLAEKLNTGFEQLVARAPGLSAQQVLQQLEQLRTLNYRALHSLDLPLGSLPTPQQLALQPLTAGYHRLEILESLRPVVFKEGEQYYAALDAPLGKPGASKPLLDFKNWVVPLGTQDLERARWRTAFLLEALHQLGEWPGDGYVHASAPAHAYVLAMRQYLGYVNATVPQPALEQRLPTTIEQVMAKAPLAEPRFELYVFTQLVRGASGEYELQFDPLRTEKTYRFPLRTSDRTLAVLLWLAISDELTKRLIQFDEHRGDYHPPLRRLLQDIQELLKRFLDELPEPTPVPNPPTQWPGGQGPAPRASGAGPLRFGALVERYVQFQHSCHTWTNPDTQTQTLGRLEALTELVGPDFPVVELTRLEIVRVRDQLRLYPQGRHRNPHLKHLPLFEILQAGAYAPIKPVTAKRYFSNLRQVLAFALDQGLIASDPSVDVAMKISTPPKAKRQYSTAQLRALLQGPALTGTETPPWRLDDYKFWLPLLGLYTGARLNELCQLRLEDIREAAGIHYLSLNTDHPGKRLKNTSSHREVPLHPTLLQVGFLALVAKRQAESANDPSALLFQGLNIIKTKLPGAYASKWFLGDGHLNRGYLHLCGLGKLGLTFHGLRHTFVGQFRTQRLDMAICKALVGHSDESTTGRYGHGYPLEAMAAELARLDYQIELGELHYARYQARQRQQGEYRRGRPRGANQTPASGSSKGHWRRHLKTPTSSRD